MLKIYLKTVKHMIDGEYTIHHSSRYVIEDESVAKTSTTEIGLYDNSITNIGYWYMKSDCKKGVKILVDTSDGLMTFKQWKNPDAKLVATITYKEQSCSMNRLFDLDADKVIAYLKQEGVNLLVSPS